MLPALARAAALIAGIGTCATAFAEVSAYGTLDMAVGRFEAAGQPGAWRADSGLMAPSRLGFKGSDDLGGGLRAIFAIEHVLRVDSGDAGRQAGDAFWSRNAYVGLHGEFGQTRLGRNMTPLYESTVLFNPFDDAHGFSPIVRQAYGGLVLADSAWNNSISFHTRNRRGADFHLIAGLGEGAGTGRNLGGNLVFIDGPLGLTFAAQQVKHGPGPLPAALIRQDAALLGLSYDFGTLRLFGQGGRVKTEALVNDRVVLVQLGASVPLGLGALQGSYGQARSDGPGTPTRHTLSLGYDHRLSPRTDVYGVYTNDRATGLSAGHTVAGGLRLRF